jgi:hypothetical protein
MRFALFAAVAGAAVATAAIAGNHRRLGDADGGTDDARSLNRGEVAARCNRQAGDRGLIGIDRQDYVEWCTSRGFRYDPEHRDDYWDDDRTCYGQANDRVLTGDRRAEFLDRCLARDDDGDYSRH